MMSELTYREWRIGSAGLPDSVTSDNTKRHTVHVEIRDSARLNATREQGSKIMLMCTSASLVSRTWLTKPLRGERPL